MFREAERALDEGARVEDIFVAEARERLSEGDAILKDGFPRPGSDALSVIHRHAHSLKGIARSLGLARIEDLSRDIAERVAPYEADAPEVPAEDRDAVRQEWSELAREVETFAARVSEEAPRRREPSEDERAGPAYL